MILSLVHSDQSGFMPGKGTDINVRQLYTNIAHANHTGSPGVVASPDAENAFELEWEVLWQVFQGFGFGPKFVSWIQLLCRAPMARVRSNGILSEPFYLKRGTRQGCPLYHWDFLH